MTVFMPDPVPFTVEEVQEMVKALNDAGVPYIEVSHSSGLGGSSFQYGFSQINEMKLIGAAASVVDKSRIAVLIMPGTGTVRELKEAYQHGARMAKIAVHATESDLAAQYIYAAKELGMEAAGLLMMAHMADQRELVKQAKQLESYGADSIYVVDSAGALFPHLVRKRIQALKDNTGGVNIGFHGYNSLSLALANTLTAIEEGATRIDGSIRCFGAGAGSTQTEVLVAVLDKLGIKTGIDLYKIMDLAEETVAPLLQIPQEIALDNLLLGYTGIHTEFSKHIRRTAAKFGIDVRDIFIELEKRKAVSGQHDLIAEVAGEIAGGYDSRINKYSFS